MAYYYIRTLIYRPAVGSSLGHKAAPALMSIADSSKHIVQIIQLLEERNMIFSFCLNKCDLLIVCGMTLLYQVVDLKQESKMMREHERLVNAVVKITERAKAPGSWDLKRIAGRLVTIDESAAAAPVSPQEANMQGPSQRSSPSMGAPRKAASTNGKCLAASASDSDLHDSHDRMRRMTMPTGQGQRPEFFRSPSRQSFENLPVESSYNGDQYMQAPRKLSARQQPTSSNLSPSRSQPNLDYLSLGNTPSQSRQTSPPRSQMQPPPPSMMPQQQRQQPGQPRRGPRQVKVPDSVSGPEWEVLLGQMDGGLNNVYDAIYGGGQPFLGEADVSALQNEWSPDTWDLSNFNIGDLGPGPAAPQSVLSLSDESLSSGEDVAPSELGLSMGSVNYANSNGSGNGDNNGNNNSNTILTGNHRYVMEPLTGFPL